VTHCASLARPADGARYRGGMHVWRELPELFRGAAGLIQAIRHTSQSRVVAAHGSSPTWVDLSPHPSPAPSRAAPAPVHAPTGVPQRPDAGAEDRAESAPYGPGDEDCVPCVRPGMVTEVGHLLG